MSRSMTRIYMHMSNAETETDGKSLLRALPPIPPFIPFPPPTPTFVPANVSFTENVIGGVASIDRIG